MLLSAVAALDKSELVPSLLKADPILTFFGIIVILLILIFLGVLRWVVVMYEKKIASIVKQSTKDKNDWIKKHFEIEKELRKK